MICSAICSGQPFKSGAGNISRHTTAREWRIDVFILVALGVGDVASYRSVCRGREVCLASQGSSAVLEGTSSGNVLLLD
jgi:hypothetical protein